MKPRVPASKYKQFIEFVELLKSKDALFYFKIAPSHIFERDESWWVDGSFIWDGTIQGHDFWSNIHEQWLSKLQREQNR